MFEANNKDTRMTLLMSIDVIISIVNSENISHCSGVSTVDFEQVNASKKITK